MNFSSMSRHGAGEHRGVEVKSFSKSTWWEFEWFTGAAAFIISNHWKTPLVPTPGCGCKYWRCLRFQVAEASVGHLGTPGTPPCPLDSQAEWQDLHMLWRAAHIPAVSGNPCGGGRQPPARGALLRGYTGKGISLCVAVKTELWSSIFWKK